MNRNRHLSTKKDQKIVHSGGKHNKEYRIVICPTYEKHVQPHMSKANATKKKRRGTA